jgi:hypothetical protein
MQECESQMKVKNLILTPDNPEHYGRAEKWPRQASDLVCRQL